MAVQAMKAGTVSFIEKPFREQMLLDAVNEAVEIDIAQRSKRAARVAVDEKLEYLTRREREILDRLTVGRTTQEVADALDISPKTVDFHRQNILDKMGVGSTVELVLACEKLRVED